jgi:hypothetical protein
MFGLTGKNYDVNCFSIISLFVNIFGWFDSDVILAHRYAIVVREL